MNHSLYPLKFKPILKERIWGGNKLQSLFGKKIPKGTEGCGESWEISGIEEDVSTVQNGFLAGNSLNELIEIYMGDLVGEKVYEKFGEEFPLLIKLIDANETLSIQVHPDDEIAKKRHHAYGKTEMWYIIDAEPNSEIITGFKRDITTDEYLRALKNDSINELLHREKAIKNDVFFIPAGRVHAIGKGILLAEIQQTSDITYRIFDWNRIDSSGKPRELHTDLAIDVIDFNQSKNPKTHPTEEVNKTTELASCPFFTVNRLILTNSIQRDYNILDSFVIFLCIDGQCSIIYGSGESEIMKQGELVLIPAELKNIIIRPMSKCTILEIYIK